MYSPKQEELGWKQEKRQQLPEQKAMPDSLGPLLKILWNKHEWTTPSRLGSRYLLSLKWRGGIYRCLENDQNLANEYKVTQMK